MLDAATPRHPERAAHKATDDKERDDQRPAPARFHPRARGGDDRAPQRPVHRRRLHSSVLGSALGGARLWTYPSWTDALGDALRLSAAMTLKNAAAGLDAGGGKSVIGLPEGTVLDADRRRAAFLDLGDAVESLGGLYRTAEDVGSTTDDMLV